MNTLPATLEAAPLVSELKATADRMLAAVAQGLPVDGEDLVVLRGNVEALAVIAGRLRMFDLSSVRVSDSRWEANGRLRAVAGSCDDRCAVCNRPVKESEAAWVHMSTDGTLFPASVSVEDAEGDPAGPGTMYWQPVGSGCARKIPSEYRAASAD